MFSAKIEKLLTFGAPISHVALPLLNGLARKRLLRGGAEQREVRVQGMPINYYYQGSPQQALVVVFRSRQQKAHRHAGIPGAAR